MYSFVISIVIDADRAVDLDMTTPILRLLIDKVKLGVVEADPVEVSLIIKITFFLFEDVYLF